MSGYEYIREMRSLYNPRTPRAAIVAAEAGVLPAEAVIYKASSVKPLFEEPYDLDELERVLAQRSLSFGDAMMLSEIFVSMTREPDKERALFAAESLTTLENRWARKVEALRSASEDESGEGTMSYSLARALYEQALIAGRDATIRNYYLLEAYYLLCERPEADSGGQGFKLLVRCLVLLGLLDQAEAEIAREAEARGSSRDDGELIALAVEIAYLRKDVPRIRETLSGRDLGALAIGEELRAILSSWQA
jgi:hypothetical protein